jgi:hypothetical protein
VWKISKYFLRRWTPYLPASYVWLIIGARQESYFNNNRAWFTAYDQNLAAASGVHVRTFRRTAKKDISREKGPLSTFISKVGDPAYVTGQPVPKQEETRYIVRLDDPLTPADAEALAYWLRRHTPERVTPQSVKELVTEARQESPHALWARETVPQAGAPDLLTVTDVVAHVFPGIASDSSWREAADRLHTHIVEAQLCHLETQYLRQKWLPEVGPGPALLLVYLRSLCYHNPQTGETRDQVSLLSGKLEALFQKSSVTLRNWFSHLDEKLGNNHAHGPFIQVLEARKLPSQKVETKYRLNLLTPLHPDDLPRYRTLLDHYLETGFERVTKEMAATSERGAVSFVSHVDRGGESSVSHVMEGDERNGSHGEGGEKSSVSGSAKKWHSYKYYKYLLTALGINDITTVLENTKQQQHTKARENAWKIEGSSATDTFAAAALGSLSNLLDYFEIHGEMRHRIVHAGLTLEAVLAWYLYAEREEGLEHPIRYMIKQASRGEPPPEQFLALAELSWEQWRTYAAASHLRSRFNSDAMEDILRMPLVSVWEDIYGYVTLDALPFGVGEGLTELARTIEKAEQVDEEAQSLPEAGKAWQINADHWRATLRELEQQMTRATFNTWLRDAVFLRREDDTFVIGVRNKAAREWLSNRLQEGIERTLKGVTGQAVDVRFVTRPE